ncbi:MAG: hypothetical protein GXO59_01455 [Dictyoglomi bacterium]|nr:hypothetical protein [Dictyoglomota bacterium]
MLGETPRNRMLEREKIPVEDLLREIKENKELMLKVLKTLSESTQEKSENSVERFFMNLGFSREFSLLISENMPLQAAEDEEAMKSFLKRYIKKHIHVKSFDKYRTELLPRVVSLVGSTGIGKTTTIAKIASILHLYRRKNVALFSIDTYRIGAIEQLEEYAKILRVPFEVIRNPEEVAPALSRHSSSDYILVDTIGRSPKDSLEIVKLASYLSAFPSTIVFLTLAANMKLVDMLSAYERFSSQIKISGVILTKLDETDDIAPALEFLMRTGIPLVYVTTGQNVPNDIMEPNVEYLIERLNINGSG